MPFSFICIKAVSKVTKKATTTKNKKNNSTKKTPTKKIKTKAKKKILKEDISSFRRVNPKLAKIVIFAFGVLFIVSSYAWFSMNMNVKVNMFKLSVQRTNDFDISFDGINFDYVIDVSKELLLKELYETYPNHNSQWNQNGFIPVSAKGVRNNNDPRLAFYESDGVLYKKKKTDDGFLYTRPSKEDNVREYNSYIAFDVFIRNRTGSPIADNLYFNKDTSIVTLEELPEEMMGLVNSFRVAIVKIGTVSATAPVEEIQGITCNNQCEAIIYEPNSKNHTNLSIERAKKFDVTLVDGIEFPTYAYVKEGGPVYLKNLVSGSPNMDLSFIELQETITEEDFNTPLFEIPDGITKARIYIWIEGQDIDSLETYSDGTKVDINLSFIKDNKGYEAFDK